MNKLITASIDVMKIDKARLIKGQKGTYLNLTIWVNEAEDKYGYDVSIEQQVKKGEDRIYLGNGKTFKKKEEPETEWKGKKEVKSMSDINDLPGAEDMPF